MNELQQQIAKHSLPELQKLYENMLMDWAEDDTDGRNLALTVLTDAQVNGDSYGVPTLVDIIETLVAEVKKHRK